MFCLKSDVRFVLSPICFVGGSCINVNCIYLGILVSNKASISPNVCVV